jgi:hypothetical protein
MMYSEEQAAFRDLLKRYMLLKVLLAALTIDREPLSQLKMGEVYQTLTDQVIDRILLDTTQIKKQIREADGKLILIRQDKEKGIRIIEYQFEGYLYKDSYMDEWIKVDCIELLKEYLKRV